MATPYRPAPTDVRRRSWRGRLFLTLLLVAGALLAGYWPRLRHTATTGAAYGARIACSCRFVAGRPLGECRKDFEGGMALVMLSEDPAAKSVTARFPLLARQTATWRGEPGRGEPGRGEPGREGPGCQLEAWRD